MGEDRGFGWDTMKASYLGLYGRQMVSLSLWRILMELPYGSTATKRLIFLIQNITFQPVSIKRTFFWNVTPCNMVDRYKYSGAVNSFEVVPLTVVKKFYIFFVLLRELCWDPSKVIGLLAVRSQPDTRQITPVFLSIYPRTRHRSLIGDGWFQFTPLKHTCMIKFTIIFQYKLSSCRKPFSSRHSCRNQYARMLRARLIRTRDAEKVNNRPCSSLVDWSLASYPY
jgi:hypothetical protein